MIRHAVKNSTGRAISLGGELRRSDGTTIAVATVQELPAGEEIVTMRFGEIETRPEGAYDVIEILPAA